MAFEISTGCLEIMNKNLYVFNYTHLNANYEDKSLIVCQQWLMNVTENNFLYQFYVIWWHAVSTFNCVSSGKGNEFYYQYRRYYILWTLKKARRNLQFVLKIKTHIQLSFTQTTAIFFLWNSSATYLYTFTNCNCLIFRTLYE